MKIQIFEKYELFQSSINTCQNCIKNIIGTSEKFWIKGFILKEKNNKIYIYIIIKKGKVNFTDLKIIFNPMKSAYLVITSQSIQKYYKTFLTNAPNQMFFLNKYSYIIPFTMRNCERGEIFLSSFYM